MSDTPENNKINDQVKFSAPEKRAVVAISSLYALRMLGLFMVLPVLALYIDDYHDVTPLMLGLALGAYGLTQALLQIPLGLLSDKIGRKPIIVAGLLIFIVGSCVAAQADSVYGIVAGRALQGAGAIASTLMALVADLTREENRTKAMASIGGSIGVAFMLAMILGPLISGWGGLPSVFWVTALLGVIGLVLTLVKIPTPAVISHCNRETQTVPSMVKATLRDMRLVRLSFGVFVLHMMLMAGFVVIPSLLETRLGFARDEHWWVYLLLLGGSFFAMIPAIIAAERGGKMKLVFLTAIGLGALSMLGLAFGYQQVSTAMPLLFLFFMAFNMLEATLPSLVSKTAPAGTRGTAMGIYSTCQFLGAFVGGVVGGWAVTALGIGGLFLLLAAMAAAWWLFALPMKAPRALMGVVLTYSDQNVDQYTRELESIPGVEGVIIVPLEKSAYAKIDKKEVDWKRLSPYLPI